MAAHTSNSQSNSDNPGHLDDGAPTAGQPPGIGSVGHPAATVPPRVTRCAAAARRQPSQGGGRGEGGTADTAGDADVCGTLAMARYLTDPAIEEEIQALARQAPPITEDQRARLGRLLRLNGRLRDRRAA